MTELTATALTSSVVFCPITKVAMPIAIDNQPVEDVEISSSLSP